MGSPCAIIGEALDGCAARSERAQLVAAIVRVRIRRAVQCLAGTVAVCVVGICRGIASVALGEQLVDRVVGVRSGQRIDCLRTQVAGGVEAVCLGAEHGSR